MLGMILIHFVNPSGTKRFSSEEMQSPPKVGEKVRLSDGWEYEVLRVGNVIQDQNGKPFTNALVKIVDVQTAWPI